MSVKPITIVLLITAALGLSGCDWFAATTSSDTQMKNVEILPGTASDEMITLDQASGDGTAIDTSIANGPVPATQLPGVAGADTGDTGDSATTVGEANAPAGDSDRDRRVGSDAGTAGDDGDRNRDTIIRPPSGRSERDGPAPKN